MISPISFNYKAYFIFKTITSIIVICKYSTYDMYNGYYHDHQTNQEKVQNSFLNHFSLSHIHDFQGANPFHNDNNDIKCKY